MITDDSKYKKKNIISTNKKEIGLKDMLISQTEAANAIQRKRAKQ